MSAGRSLDVYGGSSVVRIEPSSRGSSAGSAPVPSSSGPSASASPLRPSSSEQWPPADAGTLRRRKSHSTLSFVAPGGAGSGGASCGAPGVPSDALCGSAGIARGRPRVASAGGAPPGAPVRIVEAEAPGGLPLRFGTPRLSAVVNSFSLSTRESTGGEAPEVGAGLGAGAGTGVMADATLDLLLHSPSSK